MTISNQEGYWRVRGFDEFPGWHRLPFKDFLVDVHGSNKMWLDEDGHMKPEQLDCERDTLVPLYVGIVDTVRSIVSTSFAMYSALVVMAHIKVAEASSELECPATVQDVRLAGSDIDDVLRALRTIAFIGYEGDGLGGYKKDTWHFWGRVLGIGCPTDDEVLSQEEAGRCRDLFQRSGIAGRQALFQEWWNYLHPGTPEPVCKLLCQALVAVQRYQALERPNAKYEPRDLVPAVCGFFRRASAGISVAKSVDVNQSNHHRLADWLLDDIEGVRDLFTGHEGVTAFGQQFLRLLEIHDLRHEVMDSILSRASDEASIRDSVDRGLPYALQQRGRRRR